MNHDYQYICFLIGGGVFTDSLPMLALPNSYIYMNSKKFFVVEYIETRDTEYAKKEDFDVAVYCDEVDNDIDFMQINRDIKINKILK